MLKIEYPEEGQLCKLDGCVGSFQFPPVENCSCNLSPPCNPCIENELVCEECGISSEEWHDEMEKKAC